MLQTAMKQMVDYLEEMKSKTTDPSETYMLIDAWVHAVHLMELEKNQIINAMLHALDEDGHTGDWKIKFVETYYNTVYNESTDL
jgi:hypothetical protein